MVGTKLRTVIQLGTYKTGADPYSLDKFSRGRHGVWTILLTGTRMWDGNKGVEVYADAEVAVDALRFYRERMKRVG